MRFSLVTFIIAMISYMALWLLPWWGTMVVCFIVILVLPLKPLSAFLSASLGSSVSWLLACLLADLPNKHLLSTKISELFELPSYLLLIFVTVLIGLITGGLGGITASYLYKSLGKKRTASSGDLP